MVEAGRCAGKEEMTEMQDEEGIEGAMQSHQQMEANQQSGAAETAEIVTVVLTADNHLGSTAFGQQPKKREEWQRRLRSAFQQVTDFAVGQGVDFFIQAGDLFDSATPDERDRSFVAARLAQLRQANVRVFALGGTHDTPADAHTTEGEGEPAPQLSYARLGALTYFATNTFDLEPVTIDVRGVRVGICGLSVSDVLGVSGAPGESGVLADQFDDPLVRMHVASDIEGAAIPILILHAPIEGLAGDSSRLDSRLQVKRESIARQSAFRTILAGYHHTHHQLRLGRCDVIVAGATQHSGFNTANTADIANASSETPGFVFLGLDTNGLRWCKHIAVDALALRSLVIGTAELWDAQGSSIAQQSATEAILARLRPLCDEQAMVQLRLVGTLTRSQYHQLDLNCLRRFGEEHAFALAIDDSGLELLPESEVAQVASVFVETDERFSPREELVALADEWIAAAPDEQEKEALRATKEELLAAMDNVGTDYYLITCPLDRVPREGARPSTVSRPVGANSLRPGANDDHTQTSYC